MKKLFIILITTIFFAIKPMNAPRKEFARLSQAELKEYKDKLFIQFCAAQAIKKKCLEMLEADWNGKIESCEGDELKTSEEKFYAEYDDELLKTGIFYSDYCGRLILPLGHWKFGGVCVIYGTTKMSEFEQPFCASINAEFHKHIRSQRHPGKFVHYNLYKITKTIDGKPIPSVPALNISSEQAQLLWQEMKTRYQAEGKIK